MGQPCCKEGGVIGRAGLLPLSVLSDSWHDIPEGMGVGGGGWEGPRGKEYNVLYMIFC